MPRAKTQPLHNPRLTSPAMGLALDPSDSLFDAVKAYNTRHAGRDYAGTPADSLFNLVKAFNSRRTGLR
ncbi:MAG TPA: hypothetical protein V6D47_11055 [Oscillatoriaceae cyanobacterium]